MENLEQELQLAFVDGSPPETVLVPAIEDWHPCEEEFASQLRGVRWQDVKTNVLEQNASCFFLMTAAAQFYYLPAYLKLILRGDNPLLEECVFEWLTEPHDPPKWGQYEFWLKILDDLTDDQRTIIAKIVQAVDAISTEPGWAEGYEIERRRQFWNI
ncbi:MAG: hypothetical protein M3R13_00715 [Armatimonadota bacterium]|nr:hypothetical protein [Armatimonadota bacterium]